MAKRLSAQNRATRQPPKSDRPRTLSYIVFYILFSADSYRVLIGMAAGALFSPPLIQPDQSTPGKIVLFLMIATIGYALSAAPGRGIAAYLRKKILG